MANVLNRTTGRLFPYRKDYRVSVHTDDFPVADWIINPDLSAVQGFPTIYWEINGDAVLLVNQATRDARDAEIAADALVQQRTAAATAPDQSGGGGIQLRELFEVFNKRDNYLVNRIAELQAAMDAMKASTGAVQNLRDAIPASWLATNTRTRANAIQDYKDDINAGGAD